MDKITVRKGETFQLPVVVDDDSAVSAELKIWNEAGLIFSAGVPGATITFVDNKGTFDMGVVAQDIGLYNYSVTITYEDGVIDILPDVVGCDECEFPVFEICSGGYEN